MINTSYKKYMKIYHVQNLIINASFKFNCSINLTIYKQKNIAWKKTATRISCIWRNNFPGAAAEPEPPEKRAATKHLGGVLPILIIILDESRKVASETIMHSIISVSQSCCKNGGFISIRVDPDTDKSHRLPVNFGEHFYNNSGLG